MRRLEALFDAYFSYLGREVFPGGCFFAGPAGGTDAQGGPLHEKEVAVEKAWLAEFRGYVEVAQELGEIGRDEDPEQLVFETYAVMELANYHFVLFADLAVLERGRRAVDRLLDRARAR